MIHRQFYIKLGKLVYAIAIADVVIQLGEEEELNKLINEELSHHKTFFDSHPEYREIILTKENFFIAGQKHLKVSEAINSFHL